jgi:PTS system mannose-specific IIC component
MEISFMQILTITLYSFISAIDGLTFQAGLSNAIFAGAFTGLVMGNVKLGLAIGATLQLMGLGVASYGGASVPNYKAAAMLGTAFAAITGQSIEFAIGIAVPVGILLTHVGTLVRFVNVYFQHKSEKYAETGNTAGITKANIASSITWGFGDAIPVFLGLYFGSEVVGFITEKIPGWLITGLGVSGKILPAMGIAILMRYLPIKKYYPFMILGFAIAAFMGVNLVGVAIVGFSIAAIFVILKEQKGPQTEGGEIDD